MTAPGDVTPPRLPVPGKERTRAWRERKRADKAASEAAIAAQIAPPPQPALPGFVPRAASGGRPDGSVDVEPQAWRRFILGRRGSPLEVLADTYAAPDEVLAAELRCTRLEARALRLKAAAEALPYLHRKLPNEVILEGGGLPLVVAIAPDLQAALAAEDERRNRGREAASGHAGGTA